MALHLPQELIDHIIDSLRHDWPETSLVAKSWTTRSQRNLFHEVTIDSLRRLRRFETLVCSSPHLSSYVVELTLGSLAHVPETDVNILSYMQSPVYSRMERLRDVAFRGFFIGDMESRVNRGSLSMFLSQLPALTAIAFTNCEMHHNALYSIFMLPVSLSLLYLNGCRGHEFQVKDDTAIGDGGTIDCTTGSSGNVVVLRDARQGTVP